MAQKPRRSTVDPSSLFAGAMDGFDGEPLVGQTTSEEPPTEPKKTPTKKKPTASKPKPQAKPKTAAAPASSSASADEDGWIRVGMRVSPELAKQVATYKRRLEEEATYGQLATWACEDHPQEVVAMAEQIISERAVVAPASGGGERVSRVPRGRRGPSTSSAQLNPTFLPEEFHVIEDVQAQVRHPEGKEVPRTWVITAALRVAIRH